MSAVLGCSISALQVIFYTMFLLLIIVGANYSKRTVGQYLLIVQPPILSLGDIACICEILF